MKKIWKRLCTGFLALATVVTTRTQTMGIVEILTELSKAVCLLVKNDTQ